MSQVLDTLEEALVSIAADPKLFLDDDFMMSIFEVQRVKLKPFDDYFNHLYENKKMKHVGEKHSTAVPFAMLREELFSPKLEANQDSTPIIIDKLAEVAVNAILAEIRDENKATTKYLSSSDTSFSWDNVSHEEHHALLGLDATNDPAERSFGAATNQLQTYGKVALTSAGA